MTPTKEILEDALTEFLYMAMSTSDPLIKMWATDAAVGVSKKLPKAAVERSKDYAAYRTKALHGHR